MSDKYRKVASTFEAWNCTDTILNTDLKLKVQVYIYQDIGYIKCHLCTSTFNGIELYSSGKLT